MRRHDQPHPWPGWGEGNRWAIEKGALCPTFRVSAELDGRASKSRFDLWEVQQGVVFAPPDQPKTSGHDIGQRSGIAIEPIETNQDLGKRKRKRSRIPDDDLDGAFEVSALIPIARSRKGPH